MNDNTEADDEAQSYEEICESIDEQLEELPTVDEAELGELCRTKTMKEITDDLEEDVEELPELPTPDEAELGELSKTPEGVESHDLTKTPPTFEEIFGDDEDQTDEAVELAEEWYDTLAPKVREDGDWEHLATSEMVGWCWETPVGIVPFGIAESPTEVIDFLEDCLKTEGGDF